MGLGGCKIHVPFLGGRGQQIVPFCIHMPVKKDGASEIISCRLPLHMRKRRPKEGVCKAGWEGRAEPPLLAAFVRAASLPKLFHKLPGRTVQAQAQPRGVLPFLKVIVRPWLEAGLISGV